MHEVAVAIKAAISVATIVVTEEIIMLLLSNSSPVSTMTK